ncbi:Rieske 2Fe-2S domain-containing protein [Legionella sp. MW5194]|uniref:Rieske (2Fe-2S) protein n=1 Tax=Legionella sp. MW5194 TaxID=2662448 RepID=UPI00193D7ACC|nr:Rieske (2Fe-2S) protein [Legionella sp. MW5194]QRN02468.1 Rieske 2Fe-2S domain-containing protein [Legionella sp. MW5194]
MIWKEALALEQLRNQQRHVANIDGNKILFLWHKDKVHALSSQCPHFKLPLTKGTITEQNTIVCPFHKSEFDLDSGKVACWSPWPPAIGKLLGKVSSSKSLTIYPTRIEEGKIMVGLD